MSRRYRVRIGVHILSVLFSALLAFSFVCLPAQGQRRAKLPKQGVSNPKTVTLSGENQRVSTLITRIMAVSHANYTLDTGLAESYATVRLTNVSVTNALDALAKSCSRPFTYQVQNGVYHFALTGGTNLDAQRITLQVQSTSLAGTIASLMKMAHGNYAIDSEIETSRTALVTLSLTDVPFTVALDSLIKASSLPIAFRIENGGVNGSSVYHFMLRSKAEEIENKASGKIKYDNASLQRGGELADKRVNQDFSDTYLSHALKAVLDRVPVRYEIDASIEDTVLSQHFEDVPLPNALALLIKASGQPIIYQFENDVLRFTRKPAPK